MSDLSHTPGRFRCCGVVIDGHAPDTATAALLESRYGTPRGTHLCNAYTLSLALRDEKYRAMLNEADINFSDGHYLAKVGKKRGHDAMTERVYGPDLMYNTMDAGREHGLKHYLYGASPETVAKLKTSLEEKLPGVDIVAAESPPFRALTTAELDELEDRVADAKPDLFWVGLGTPETGRVRGSPYETAALHPCPRSAPHSIFGPGTNRWHQSSCKSTAWSGPTVWRPSRGGCGSGISSATPLSFTVSSPIPAATGNWGRDHTVGASASIRVLVGEEPVVNPLNTFGQIDLRFPAQRPYP